MQNTRNTTFSRTSGRRFLAALTATAAVFAGNAAAQDIIHGRPYGQPSECLPGGPATLGLYLTQGGGELPTLRLEGGTPGKPAIVIFATAAAQRPLPGGGTQLIASAAAMTNGTFDAHGVFRYALTGARFDAAGDRLFVQGVQPMTGAAGTELSGGLQLQRRRIECAPPDGSPRPPDEILVEEFGGLMRQGHLEAALDVALNSKDDALTLDLDGSLQVPVYPGITVGGKAAFKAEIKRGENSSGATIYDLEIGADVAAAAGVGAGVAGVGVSNGAGVTMIWRYQSTHEVARAVRAMVILQAVGPRLELACLALNTQLARIDRAVNAARRAADRARRAVRSRMPWRHNPFVQRLQRHHDAMRALRHRVADRARGVVGRLISWVAVERIFLITHLHGYEVRQTVAIDASVGVNAGAGDSSEGGEATGANLGAGIAGGVEQQIVLRAEFVPESDAVRFERKVLFTRSIKANAGFGAGAAVAAKREIELSTKLQAGKDGVHRAESGTTVKLTLDGKLLAALGAVATVQAGVGGQVAVELRLADLLAYSKDAIAILLGDDEHKAAELLLAFPIKFAVRGRYEAGIAIGIGLKVDGAFEFGIGGSARMTDWGAGFTYEGGSGSTADRGETAPHLLVEALRGALVRPDDAGLQNKLNEVREEVSRFARK